VKKAFLLICVGVGLYQGYRYLEERRVQRLHDAFEASEPKNRSGSRAGFIDAVEPDGINPFVMTVLMPVGCPLEAGRRGRALIEKMKAANIPVTASSNAQVHVNAATRAEFDAKMSLVNKVMGGETPIVFFKARAKNNPSFEDVLLEYQTSQ
jgi:hypothetical protein